MSKSYRLTAVFLSLILLSACESDLDRSHKEAFDRLQAQAQRESVARIASKPALAVKPCDRPRPYKNWTNAELNVAQVEYMGTPQSMELIREAACRTQ